MNMRYTSVAGLLLLGAAVCAGQTAPPPIPAPPPTAAGEPGPLSIDLKDALARAKRYGLQIQGAQMAASIAREDVKQVKAARLPALTALNQFLYTEGNGTPTGTYVTANGVHVYTEEAQVHEEVLALARRGELHQAEAAAAAARARVDIASRGLTATVVQNFYSVVGANRKVANARTSLQEAERFLDITQKQEKGGEVAHVDTIKAQIQVQQRQRELSDAELNVEKAKIGLAILLFPQLREDFTAVDDMESGPQISAVLSPLPEMAAAARSTSPDLRAAQESLRAATAGVSVARYGYLPSLALDFFYGINSNELATRIYDAQDPFLSALQTTPGSHRNLGYQAQVTLNIPVWNWGATRSRINQADLRRQQAELDLSLTQRLLGANVEAAYREAGVAQAQLASLRSSVDLSVDNLRLTLLRYQAGESTALEVVDAQSTVTQARNAYSDGLARYATAAATLQTLTGNL